LVLFGLTAQNDSAARAVVISIHLLNTFLLLAALALTAWWASGGDPLKLRGTNNPRASLGIAWLLLILLGASGAVTALGDTLFPSGSLIEGMQQDINPTAHFLLRLRIYHPIIAVITALSVVYLVRRGQKQRPTAEVGLIGNLLMGIIGLQLGLGMLNVLLLAPVWMQMLHLLAADLVWIGLVIFSAALLAVERDPASASSAVPGGRGNLQTGRYLSPGN
jgi:heme A synthase